MRPKVVRCAARFPATGVVLGGMNAIVMMFIVPSPYATRPMSIALGTVADKAKTALANELHNFMYVSKRILKSKPFPHRGVLRFAMDIGNPRILKIFHGLLHAVCSKCQCHIESVQYCRAVGFSAL